MHGIYRIFTCIKIVSFYLYPSISLYVLLMGSTGLPLLLKHVFKSKKNLD